MSDKTLLFIHALTGLHPGSGTALGVVDLPVQRERHTDWPLIPGSSLKGVMRAGCAKDDRENNDVLAAFGPETGPGRRQGQTPETTAASDHAGAVAFSDARILAFPVRSLTGVFAWVTCRDVLTRLERDLKLVGADFPAIPRVEEGKAACARDSPLIAHGEKLMLEELEFSHGGDAGKIADWIASQAVEDEGTKDRLRSHLAVLPDDDFVYFVRNATEVVARIGLDEKKTVRTGALFYEEYLPAETLFYSLVICSDSRRPGSRLSSAADILNWLCDSAPKTLQIGGGETVGKGFCAVRFADPAKEKDHE